MNSDDNTFHVLCSFIPTQNYYPIEAKSSLVDCLFGNQSLNELAFNDDHKNGRYTFQDEMINPQIFDRYCFSIKFSEGFANFSISSLDWNPDNNKCFYTIQESFLPDLSFSYNIIKPAVHPESYPGFILKITFLLTLSCQSKDRCGSQNIIENKSLLWPNELFNYTITGLIEGASYTLELGEVRDLSSHDSSCPEFLETYPPLPAANDIHKCGNSREIQVPYLPPTERPKLLRGFYEINRNKQECNRMSIGAICYSIRVFFEKPAKADSVLV